jgi:hypothetical protein
MGHSTARVLYETYREMVSPEEGNRYFNIFPPEAATNIVPMAAA